MCVYLCLCVYVCMYVYMCMSPGRTGRAGKPGLAISLLSRDPNTVTVGHRFVVHFFLLRLACLVSSSLFVALCCLWRGLVFPSCLL